MRLSLLCTTRQTILSNRRQNVPNLCAVFAQQVSSICPTCGQCLPNCGLHLPNIKAVFAQHNGHVLPNKIALLPNCWANAICWALFTGVGQNFQARHRCVLPEKFAQQNRNLYLRNETVPVGETWQRENRRVFIQLLRSRNNFNKSCINY